MATNSTDKPTTAKAPDVVRENDGHDQLVGYLGWKTILERLETQHRRP
jgi:hypothetical protein